MNDHYVVEFSMSSKTFHIHSVEEMLETNIQNAIAGNRNDHMPLAIASNEKEAYEISSQLKKRLLT